MAESQALAKAKELYEGNRTGMDAVRARRSRDSLGA
jgi:hypothetical protein